MFLTMKIVLVFGCLLLVTMSSLTKGILSPITTGWNSFRSSTSLHSSTSSTAQLPVCRAQRFPTTATNIHVIILVHGWMGNPAELGYLEESLKNQANAVQEAHPETFYLVHSAKANDGKTSDGIAAGGGRLATEVNGIIHDVANQIPENQLEGISLSFVGNSLGGLYARYALAEIPALQPNSPLVAGRIRVEPKVFCTTATPHLGVSQHTYLPLPRPAEYLVASVMQPTGRDLFRYTDVIERLTTDATFFTPLQQFHKRIAYANAYQTDFQVPTTTAAFLSATDSTHRRLGNFKDSSFVSLTVETPVDRNHLDNNVTPTQVPASSDELARRLDALGWVKVLCDVRTTLPSFPLPFPFASSTPGPTAPQKTDYESSELLQTYASRSDRWHAPFGHTVLVANSKNDFYAKINAAGKPIMDQLAAELITDIGL